jgi:nicotinamidase/pyrazinamidase
VGVHPNVFEQFTSSRKMPGTTLLIVDAQKDFHPGGSLAVPTANDDAARIANLIRQNASSIDRIVATMDSHHKLHIAHPSFWISGDDEQKHPDPFTIISADDLVQGKWKPRPNLTLPLDEAGKLDAYFFSGIENVQDESGAFDLTKYCVEYSRRLEAKGRFQICVWPEHCLIGSTGHAVVDSVKEALDEWSEKTGRSVLWVMKGQNLLTEMYSALAAEVPVSRATAFNYDLQALFLQSDRLIVCGQAMSHCVNYTLRDILGRWPKEETHRIALVTDCASAVPGFEAAAVTFQKDMEAAGVSLKQSANVM